VIHRGLIFLVLASGAFAQLSHVAWTPQADPPAAAPGGKAILKMTGRIDPGWHLYSA